MTRVEMEQQLLASIRKYNRSAAKVLQAAMDEGGPDRVNELEKEYDAFRAAYFDLVRAKLNENHEQYAALVRETSDAADAVDRAVDKLASTADVLTALSSVTILAKRIVDTVRS